LIVVVVDVGKVDSFSHYACTHTQVIEVQRDYLLTLPLTKLTSAQPLPLGLNVLGDGVFYWLACTKFKGVVGTLVETRLSQCYDVRIPGEAQTLFRLCVAAARQAYAAQHTYAVEAALLPHVDDERFAFVEILDCNESSVLFRFRDHQRVPAAAAASGARIGKLPRMVNKRERFDREVGVWQQHGALLKRSDCFVQLTATDFFAINNVLVFVDDGGVSLERICRCTPETRGDLLRVVHRDVSRALTLLHGAAPALAFVDLHPGNVIICTDAAAAAASGNNKCAKLIDCESVRTFGASLADVPIRPRFASLDKTTASQESDAESFLYLLAWTVDEFCATMREDNAHQAAFNTRKREIGAKWPTPQILINEYSK